MPSTTQHGSRVVYVAGLSAGVPDAVQVWLDEHPTQHSPDIYDALAALTGRQRPVALIVNLEAVDWQEMDFFDVAARVSRETRVYVVGLDHHRSKIEAAVAKGARRFSSEDLAEDLARPAPGSQRAGVGDLLAGSLREATKRGVRAAVGSRLRQTELVLVPRPAEGPVDERSEVDGGEPSTCSVKEGADLVSPPVPVSTEAGVEAGSVPAEPVREERPNVRLVGLVEEARPPAKPETSATPFPWSPSPSRPKRIPPASAGNRSPVQSAPPVDAAKSTSPGEPGVPSAASPARLATPLPVELTADELAALMAKSSESGSTSRQGRQG
ncbi:MAG TPA: hypothetical protein PKY77_03465 [Phycisphaerae bacterium]|nr:hypothetical protein [Phycisphaerae bacterium]HRY67343.1 hypothetical protein [Phycisphaerae bacterium]HSA28486.1 hypothetical protein [Phycisphaerae bacterium]